MKKRILGISLVPIVLMALNIILLTTTVIKADIKQDTENNLKGIASAVLAMYDQNSGDYIVADNGDVWKGAYDISKSQSLLDSIKEESGVDVTFCYGDKRIISSAKDTNGDAIVGSAVGENVTNVVLKKGEPLFTENVLVGDVEYFGYYVPVIQNGSDEVVGMVFAGVPTREGMVAYWHIFQVLIAVSVIFLVVFSLSGAAISNAFSKAIQAGTRAVEEVAAGQLMVEIDTKYLHRGDEIGKLCRAVDGMKNELRYIIEDINNNTQNLLASANSLDENAQSTLSTVDNVDRAVNEIAEGATSQAKDAARASENVSIMGDMIDATGREIEHLNANARVMQQSSEVATQSLAELSHINQEVMDAIDMISAQTNLTNQSSQKIKEATNIISNISDETTLLALNASIEAARAGEQGRGFAVVANEIQHLAEQSGVATESIADMVNELLLASEKAVETMERVRDIVLAQSKKMGDTQTIVQNVIAAVDASTQSISSIERQSEKLNDAKEEIVAVVETLSAIAEQNAASTEETSAATTEVAESFNDVTNSAETLKTIANSIAQTMGTFRIEE